MSQNDQELALNLTLSKTTLYVPWTEQIKYECRIGATNRRTPSLAEMNENTEIIITTAANCVDNNAREKVFRCDFTKSRDLIKQLLNSSPQQQRPVNFVHENEVILSDLLTFYNCEKHLSCTQCVKNNKQFGKEGEKDDYYCLWSVF